MGRTSPNIIFKKKIEAIIFNGSILLVHLSFLLAINSFCVRIWDNINFKTLTYFSFFKKYLSQKHEFNSVKIFLFSTCWKSTHSSIQPVLPPSRHIELWFSHLLYEICDNQMVMRTVIFTSLKKYISSQTMIPYFVYIILMLWFFYFTTNSSKSTLFQCPEKQQFLLIFLKQWALILYP